MIPTLSSAARDVEATGSYLSELKRWSRASTVGVMVSLPASAVITVQAVLIEPRLAIATIPFGIMLVLSVILWTYVNISQVYVPTNKSEANYGYGNGYHTTRMKRARRQVANAVDRYEAMVTGYVSAEVEVIDGESTTS